MNIPNRIGSHIPQAHSSQLKPAASDSARTAVHTPKEEPRKSDEVVLSERAQLLRKVREALSAAPEVREDRVAELRAQIQKGTYQVPEDELIAALLGGLKD